MKILTTTMLLAAIVRALSAQQSTTPPTLVRMEMGTCPRCTLTLERVAVVGSANDTELIPEAAMPAVPHPGQFLVGDVWGHQPISRYDANGRYVGALGQLGEGPGEIHGQQAIVAARGDSIGVYRYPRLAVISSQSGRGRSVTHRADIHAFRLLMLPDGSAVLQNYAERNAAFVVVAPSGETTRAFGPAAGTIDVGGGRMVGDYDAQQFLLARSPSGGFWAAAMYYRHLLEHWTIDGTSLLRIDRKPAWFTPSDYAGKEEQQRLGDGLSPPVSMTVGIWVDAAGHLFVVGRTADAKWRKDPAAEAPAVRGEAPPKPAKPLTGGINRYVDGVMEVYDEKTGALLGSWRFDVPPPAFTEAGLLVAGRQDADGIKSFVFWRPVFVVH